LSFIPFTLIYFFNINYSPESARKSYKKNEKNKQLDINIKYSNEMFKFSIKDHGKGINKEEVFNKLKSGNSSLKKVNKKYFKGFL